MQNSFFSIMQRVGRSFMLPIALLPVAGLMLGFGASFTNATNIAAYGLEGILGNGTVLHSLLTVMKSAGSIIFSNLPILFAVGVAMGMAKKEKDVCCCYWLFHYACNNQCNAGSKWPTNPRSLA